MLKCSLASATAFLRLVVEAFLRDVDLASRPIWILACLPVACTLLPVNELPELIGRPRWSHDMRRARRQVEGVLRLADGNRRVKRGVCDKRMDSSTSAAHFWSSPFPARLRITVPSSQSRFGTRRNWGPKLGTVQSAWSISHKRLRIREGVRGFRSMWGGENGVRLIIKIRSQQSTKEVLG